MNDIRTKLTRGARCARTLLHRDRTAAGLGFAAIRAVVAAPPAREVRDALARGLVLARLFALIEA